jgi:hypothetical protein
MELDLLQGIRHLAKQNQQLRGHSPTFLGFEERRRMGAK